MTDCLSLATSRSAVKRRNMIGRKHGLRKFTLKQACCRNGPTLFRVTGHQLPNRKRLRLQKWSPTPRGIRWPKRVLGTHQEKPAHRRLFQRGCNGKRFPAQGQDKQRWHQHRRRLRLISAASKNETEFATQPSAFGCALKSSTRGRHGKRMPLNPSKWSTTLRRKSVFPTACIFGLINRSAPLGSCNLCLHPSPTRNGFNATGSVLANGLLPIIKNE